MFLCPLKVHVLWRKNDHLFSKPFCRFAGNINTCQSGWKISLFCCFSPFVMRHKNSGAINAPERGYMSAKSVMNNESLPAEPLPLTV